MSVWSLSNIFFSAHPHLSLRLFFSRSCGHFSLRRLSSSLVLEPTHFQNMIVELDHFLRARTYQNISKTTHLENVSDVSCRSIWANSIIAACNLYLSWTNAIFLGYVNFLYGHIARYIIWNQIHGATNGKVVWKQYCWAHQQLMEASKLVISNAANLKIVTLIHLIIHNGSEFQDFNDSTWRLWPSCCMD